MKGSVAIQVLLLITDALFQMQFLSIHCFNPHDVVSLENGNGPETEERF